MDQHAHAGDRAERATVATRDEIDLARAATYLLLATLLRDVPSTPLIEDLARLTGDESPLGQARGALAAAAFETSAAAAAHEYQSIFIGVGRGEVLPYGSYYLTGFLNERPLARVRRAMKDLGIARADGVFEPEDHLGSLCEVMAALLSGTIDKPSSTADRFFEKHLAAWAARACGDIEGAPSARFYKAVGAFGRTWFAIEAEALVLANQSAAPGAATH